MRVSLRGISRGCLCHGDIAPLGNLLRELLPVLNLLSLRARHLARHRLRALHEARVAARLREKTRDEWTALLEGTDVCFAPVLTLAEAPLHQHAQARGAFVQTADGHWQPSPAPRFEPL